jgi:hypothetical protein
MLRGFGAFDRDLAIPEGDRGLLFASPSDTLELGD